MAASPDESMVEVAAAGFDVGVRGLGMSATPKMEAKLATVAAELVDCVTAVAGNGAKKVPSSLPDGAHNDVKPVFSSFLYSASASSERPFLSLELFSKTFS